MQTPTFEEARNMALVGIGQLGDASAGIDEGRRYRVLLTIAMQALHDARRITYAAHGDEDASTVLRDVYAAVGRLADAYDEEPDAMAATYPVGLPRR